MHSVCTIFEDKHNEEVGLYRRTLINVMPGDGANEGFNIFFEEADHGRQGVVVGKGIKVEGTSQEVVGGVCDKKLVGRGSLCSVDVEPYPIDLVLPVFVAYLINARGFWDVLYHKVVGIFDEIGQVVVHPFVAEVQGSVKLRIAEVYPVSLFPEAIFDEGRAVVLIGEGVGVAFVKENRFGLGQIDAKKPPWPRNGSLITGDEEYEEGNEDGEIMFWRHGRVFEDGFL